MRVLFAMRHSGYVRNFESTLRLLCERGHRVHVAFQGKVKYAQLDPTDIARQLAAECQGFSHGAVTLRGDGWGLVGRELRLGLDYLRYLGPEYREAPKLRERARREAPSALLNGTTAGFRSTTAGRWATAAWLSAMHRAIPADPEVGAFLQKARPDLLVVTPLIEPGAPQAELLRSARALGVRTVFCVASWDNLTNKGLVHGPVDLVTVWNESMKREAVELHGIPASRVLVTGAAAFDHWFDWKPSTTREAFCARVGLPPDRPYVLYLCSSKFVAPQEAPFVRAWAEALRRSGARTVRDAGILVRPHPQNAEQWQSVDLRALGVSVWPAGGAAPVDTASRSDYYDSMFHSSVVVGVNTTAEIESAILGRPVCTYLAPEFRDTQDGTLHFHHLREVNGGLLDVARDLDEHLAQLEAAISRTDDTRARRFVEAFVRPHGLDVPATPKLVDALEALARSPAPAPEREPFWVPFVRTRIASRRDELERQARAEQEAKAARHLAKETREAKRQVRQAERRAQVAEKAARDAEKARQALEERTARAEAERVTRQERLQSLVEEFRELGEVDRRSFLRASFELIPHDSFVELHAAAKPRKLDYDRADIYLRVATKGEAFRLGACAKEPFTIEWLEHRVRAGDVLYDIGANIGVYSLVAAKKPGGGAAVFSFEPSYASVASLCANIVLNDVARQVTPIPVALAGATGMNVLSLRDLEPGAARHALGGEPPVDGPALYRQPVMAFRLDDAIEYFRLPPPNHIKLDVDGGELGVLAGASRTLASPALRSMLIEVSSSLSGPVSQLVERQGLRLDSKFSVKNKAGEYAVWYGLFVRDCGIGAAAGAS